MQLPTPECPSHPDGRAVTQADLDAITDKLNHRPLELTAFDVSVTKYFHGDAGARLVEGAMKSAQARQRHAAMRVVPAPTATVVSAPSTSKAFTLGQISRTIRKTFSPRAKRGTPFDRNAFVRDTAERQAQEPQITPGEYDRVAWLTAQEQYQHDPSGLTDRDLRQLSLIDPEEGAAAKNARDGKEVVPEPDAEFDDVPASLSSVFTIVGRVKTDLSHWLGTVMRLCREAHVLITGLQSQVNAVRAQLKATPPPATAWAQLSDRVKALESSGFMRYRGVYQPDQVYERNSLVTTADGTAWIAGSVVRAGLQPGTPETPWRAASPTAKSLPGTLAGRPLSFERVDPQAKQNYGPAPQSAADKALEQRIEQLEQRVDGAVAEIKSAASGFMHYRGVWEDGRVYHKGDCVTFGGSIFHAEQDTKARPETHPSWKLAVKRGRDGRDR